MDERGYGGEANFSKRLPLIPAKLSGLSLEKAEAFLPNPVTFDLKRVNADLGSVLVVASVENVSGPSMEGPGGENHDSQIDYLCELQVLYFEKVT